MKACVFTLGCKMNEVESASLMRGLEELGFEVTDELGFADLYLLNTCAVTAEAEKKSRQAITRMRKFNPSANIIVLGCAAERNAEEFAKRENVTLVTGAQNKSKVLDMLQESGIFCENESAFAELPAPKRTKTRAFVRIQDGCNRYCSYCVIPYLRGRSRSRSMAHILEEVKNSEAKEIVLTGIDISSYQDGENDLSALLTALSGAKARIRLGSLEAGIISEEFLKSMKAAGNVVPQFHLSLQSGSSKVLKNMNRHYTREEYLACCKKIYEIFPNAAITTDIIVGYPTETEEDFLESLSIIEKAGFARIHCFPYSERPKTASAKLKDLPSAVKKERMGRITAAAKLAQQRYVEKFLGQELIVLFEDDGGYSENYIRVYADGAREGDLCRVRLTGLGKDGAKAEILEVL